LGGLVALDRSSVTGLRKRSKSNSHRTGEQNLSYASFSGTAAKNGVKSSNPYSHHSLLKLIETVRGGGSLGQGDMAAPSPTEYLR